MIFILFLNIGLIFKQNNTINYIANKTYAAYNYTASVTAVAQAKSNWCWAACAQMAGRNSNPSSTRDQWYAVGILKGTGYPNVTGTIEECAAASSIVTNSTRGYSYTISNMYSIFKNRLMSGYVSIMCMSGHSVAIYRLDNNSGSDRIYFIDPNGGVSRNYTYSSFSAGGFGGRVMEALVYIN